MSDKPAIVVLGASGLDIGRRLVDIVPGAALHGLAGRVSDADIEFDDTGAHLRDLFAAGQTIVGVCAAGVLVRSLAPALADKRAEPPVLAVAEDGSAVVPLLGGHHGANDLARHIAEALGGVAAITTAGDLRFGVALDEPPAGWVLANPEHMKGFTAALLAGAGVRLEGEAGWLQSSRLSFVDDGALTIRVTDEQPDGDERTLIYHPKRLALGVGCERGAPPEEVIGLVERTLSDAGLSTDSVGAIVSIDVKADEPAVHAVAERLNQLARFFDAARLEEELPRLATPSELVFREVGCHGVAEGAALAAAGPDGGLIVAKQKSARATCAIARAPDVIVAHRIGRGQGSLAVVGIGPGSAAWRTAEADALLDEASDIVGYGLYLDLLGASTSSKTQHRFELGAEEVRVRAALDLAAEGHNVALVSSGDAGIYAMATLVFELLDRENRAGWNRIRVAVTPGVSAMQAAAARAGAPLGHDFCAISLSDLLTPWTAIEKRIEAAAAGDFVVAFYNPVSKRRGTQLARARDILLNHRPPETPVVVARNLGRDSETVDVTTLAALDPGALDMLTLVLVGSSETRAVGHDPGRVYTPRGYAGKSERATE